MSDMIDLYQALAEQRQEERADRRAHAPKALEEAGIRIASTHNGGAHLVIHNLGRIIDFWPGTGLWIVRGTTIKRRGLQPLIAFCKRGTK